MNRVDRQNVQFLAESFIPDAWRPLRFITEVLTVLLGWLTLSITVWTRVSHGDRYLSLSRVILAWLTMQLFGSLTWMALGFLSAMGMRQGGFGGWMLNPYATAFLVMCAFAAWKNRQRTYYQHSRSFGVSRLLPLLRKLAALLPAEMRDAWLEEKLDWWTYRLIEPAMIFLLGWLVGQTLDPTMGLYLQVCSVALLLEAQLAYSDRKNRYFDHLDALLESHALQAMIEGKPAPQHTGVHAVPMPAEWLTFEPLDVETTVQHTLQGSAPDRQSQTSPGSGTGRHPFAATVANTMQRGSSQEGTQRDHSHRK